MDTNMQQTPDDDAAAAYSYLVPVGEFLAFSISFLLTQPLRPCARLAPCRWLPSSSLPHTHSPTSYWGTRLFPISPGLECAAPSGVDAEIKCQIVLPVKPRKTSRRTSRVQPGFTKCPPSRSVTEAGCDRLSSFSFLMDNVIFPSFTFFYCV